MSVLAAGHQLHLIHGGQAYFVALIEAIEAAEREIALETYIFNHDPEATKVAHALAGAALRGVAVRVLVDGYGTAEFAPELRQLLETAGVQVAVFSPFGSAFWNTVLWRHKRMRRLHRKLCVVDARVAFCGGINLLDDYIDPNHGVLKLPRFDFAVRVQGPLVADALRTMQRTWQRVQLGAELAGRSSARASALQIGDGSVKSAPSGVTSRTTNRTTSRTTSSINELSVLTRDAGALARERLLGFGRQPDFLGSLDVQSEAGDSAAAAKTIRAGLLLRDNVRNRHRIERAYLALIRTARSEIIIANAYFLPGRRLRRALRAASARGVQVTLLLQGRYEYFLQYHATHALYGFLLDNNIAVHQYTASFLHAKVAVFDGRFAMVGSSNLDPLSLSLAQEANVLIDNAAVAIELRSALMDAMAVSAEQLDAQVYARRSWRERWRDWLAYGLVRIGARLFDRSY